VVLAAAPDVAALRGVIISWYISTNSQKPLTRRNCILTCRVNRLKVLDGYPGTALTALAWVPAHLPWRG
jgi:hypothetical protein